MCLKSITNNSSNLRAGGRGFAPEPLCEWENIYLFPERVASVNELPTVMLENVAGEAMGNFPCQWPWWQQLPPVLSQHFLEVLWT